MKNCGVVDLLKEVRVYARYPMGVSCSETYLEELMYRLLSDLLRDEFVTKELETYIVVLINWGKVLYAMDWPNNLRRSQGKTVVRPPSTAVLGTICPKFFPHLTTLHRHALVSCESPRNVCVFLAFDGSFWACGQALNGYISFSSGVTSSWSPISVYGRLVR